MQNRSQIPTTMCDRNFGHYVPAVLLQRAQKYSVTAGGTKLQCYCRGHKTTVLLQRAQNYSLTAEGTKLQC
jgi:hypothetical protein